MQRIPLHYAKSGMKIAQEIKNQDGHILCGPGVELTSGLIERLAKSDVHVIVVDGHPVELPDEKSITERLKELDERFSKVKSDPVLRAIMKLIAEQMIEQEKR